jgi:hypothetical protein
MKMTKLMAALVVVTIMMTSVVFGATTATTTAYDLDASTFDVQTVVTGANDATKLTYVLYNGATPDEDTIIYIDQKDGSLTTHTFAVNDIPADKFVGSDIIANDDVSDEADTAPVGDFYKLTRGTMTGIENVTFATADGTVYDFGGKPVSGISFLTSTRVITVLMALTRWTLQKMSLQWVLDFSTICVLPTGSTL